MELLGYEVDGAIKQLGAPQDQIVIMPFLTSGATDTGIFAPNWLGIVTDILTDLSRSKRKDHVATALGVVGLTHRTKHFPRTLSGGEQQRVGIARAIVTDPTLLLCDEPTGDLDRKAGDEILDLLQALNREHGKTIIMVTHDPHASARASRTVYLNKGQLSSEPVK